MLSQPPFEQSVPQTISSNMKTRQGPGSIQTLIEICFQVEYALMTQTIFSTSEYFQNSALHDLVKEILSKHWDLEPVAAISCNK